MEMEISELKIVSEFLPVHTCTNTIHMLKVNSFVLLYLYICYRCYIINKNINYSDVSLIIGAAIIASSIFSFVRKHCDDAFDKIMIGEKFLAENFNIWFGCVLDLCLCILRCVTMAST